MRFGKCNNCNKYKHIPNGICNSCKSEPVTVAVRNYSLPFKSKNKSDTVHNKISEMFYNHNQIDINLKLNEEPDYEIAIFDESITVRKNNNNKKEYKFSAYQSNLSELCDDILEYILN